ncbi:MAG: hypothetical protein ABW007_27310 [Chitinophagaceae bacterium]
MEVTILSEDKDLKDEGRHDTSVGKLEETIGREAGLDELETAGRVRQAEGEIKEGIGKATDAVDGAADDAVEKLRH